MVDSERNFRGLPERPVSGRPALFDESQRHSTPEQGTFSLPVSLRRHRSCLFQSLAATQFRARNLLPELRLRGFSRDTGEALLQCTDSAAGEDTAHQEQGPPASRIHRQSGSGNQRCDRAERPRAEEIMHEKRGEAREAGTRGGERKQRSKRCERKMARRNRFTCRETSGSEADEGKAEQGVS
jgi:hypothetical protein